MCDCHFGISPVNCSDPGPENHFHFHVRILVQRFLYGKTSNICTCTSDARISAIID